MRNHGQGNRFAIFLTIISSHVFGRRREIVFPQYTPRAKHGQRDTQMAWELPWSVEKLYGALRKLESDIPLCAQICASHLLRAGRSNLLVPAGCSAHKKGSL